MPPLWMMSGCSTPMVREASSSRKRPARVVPLPDRDRHRRFPGDAHQRCGIPGQARLLQKGDAQWRQRLAARTATGGDSRPWASTISSTSGPTASRTARTFATPASIRRLAGQDRHGLPGGHLERGEAPGDEIDRRAGHLLRRVAAWPIGVGADAIAHRAAQQAVDRDAQRLPLDIPEGDLDSGQRAEERWPAMPEGVPVGLLPEMLDAGRIGSQQQRLEILDHPQHGVGLPSERGLAEPGQPIVGVDRTKM